ncbi:site-specific integrase [Cereibacter sp. SYSU M97828]|nr:site-specific integrase [Cereibacter flavus]
MKAAKEQCKINLAKLGLPVPGFPAFDSDDQFLKIPLFATDGVKQVAGSPVWTLPPWWVGVNTTTPLGKLNLKFPEMSPPTLHHSYVTTFKSSFTFPRKAMFLTLFWSKEPFALSTIRNHHTIYCAFSKYAIAEGIPIHELSLDNLEEVISSLSDNQKAAISTCNGLMRTWHSASPAHFRGYPPPPRTRLFRVNDHSTPPVINTDIDKETHPTLPLPDNFLNSYFSFAFDIIDNMQPALMAFYSEARLSPTFPRLSRLEIQAIAERVNWPQKYSIRNARQLKHLLNIYQISVISLVSLMLGSRWSEIGSLSKKSLVNQNDASKMLQMRIFKGSPSFSGQLRQVPLNDGIASILSRHVALIEMIEKEDFPHLWRSNESIINSSKPMRQIHKNLHAFMRAGNIQLEDGSKFSHHRFRSTLARLVILALRGGIMILRRLLGHVDVEVTLGYFRSDSNFAAELEEAARIENEYLLQQSLENREGLTGAGASSFRDFSARIQNMTVLTATGKRGQANTSVEDMVAVMSSLPAEEFQIAHILPGLVRCCRPLGKSGVCCKASEPQDISKCDALCSWHIQTEEFRDFVRKDVAEAVQALESVDTGSLQHNYYKTKIESYRKRYPDVIADLGFEG